ncbi:phosphoribosylamine--glycine ligase [Kiritimatiella glycovorans]|uniref:Phosphoribosylamine--glycine ligase n=1 Tax=Kiritimatiella glycovorans TaxID=1307763 RepID=A0A0G3EF52_9BACT|nr:phosphoribosylamine--glycine ligase [Kiritimatiella glycovorans]AKJ65086.1 Phosphoribosylamine--glycine ligase [Kiritimatiella glycovorans]
MKVLVVGSGGREHALVRTLASSPRKPELLCAPGNAGTARLARNLPVKATDLDGLVSCARAERPDLTVIGPEAPLCAGLTDALEAEGLAVFGPSKEAARLEGSKIFAKEIMQAAGVPTARAESFDDPAAACACLREHGAPVVVKADGLAAGKGVTVCASIDEAERAVREALEEKRFGDAGGCVLIEDCLRGEEASILALTDGETVVPLASSQDHKRAYDGDRGPNTGGMGAYSPAPVVSEDVWRRVMDDIYRPTLAELRRRGIRYKGVLYAGLMIEHGRPRVVEFNCRFGDPETQVVLPRLDSDLLPALQACVDGDLASVEPQWKSEACVCVVMASGGYPGPYEKGLPIEGLNAAEEAGTIVFHAGTDADPEGRVVTAGGRVLGVTALGATLKTAVASAYRGAGKISWDHAFYRTDIAHRELEREEP